MCTHENEDFFVHELCPRSFLTGPPSFQVSFFFEKSCRIWLLIVKAPSPFKNRHLRRPLNGKRLKSNQKSVWLALEGPSLFNCRCCTNYMSVDIAECF